MNFDFLNLDIFSQTKSLKIPWWWGQFHFDIELVNVWIFKLCRSYFILTEKIEANQKSKWKNCLAEEFACIKAQRSTIKKSAVSSTILLFVCITGPPLTFLWWLQFWPQCINTLELRFFAMPRVYRQIWWTLFAGSMEHSQVIFNEIVALFDIFLPLDQKLITNLHWIYLFSRSNCGGNNFRDKINITFWRHL